MPIEPGQIYLALLEGPGRRPVTIVSRAELNRGNRVVAVPLTSRRLADRRHLPNCVPFRSGQFGLDRECVAQAEAIGQVRVDELDLETGSIGVLDSETHRSLIRAIAYVLGAEFESV